MNRALKLIKRMSFEELSALGDALDEEIDHRLERRQNPGSYVRSTYMHHLVRGPEKAPRPAREAA